MVKADGYGHGAIWAARAALARRRHLAGGGHRRRGGGPAPARDRRAPARDGRAHAGGAAHRRWRPTPTWWSGPGVRARSGRRRSPRSRACTSSSTPAWAGWARRTSRARVRLGGRDGRRLAGLMTHFATADEPGDEHFPAQLERFTEFVEASAAGRISLVHAANSAATFREPAAHFDMVRCGVAIYGWTRSRGTRPSAASSRRCRSSRRWPRSSASSRGTAPATGGRWRAPEPTWVAHRADRLRRRLAPRLCQRLRRLDRRPATPLVGTVSMDNVTDRRGRRHRRRGRRRGGADRGAGRRADPRRGGGGPARARSTTRSPAGCRRGCARHARRGEATRRCASRGARRTPRRLGRGRDGPRRAARAAGHRRGPGGARRPGGGRPGARDGVRGPGVPRCRRRFGAWRALDRGAGGSTTSRRSRARRIEAGSRAARLQRERHGAAAGGRRA